MQQRFRQPTYWHTHSNFQWKQLVFQLESAGWGSLQISAAHKFPPRYRSQQQVVHDPVPLCTSVSSDVHLMV